MELISNPMEQRAFERMDEDIRLIGYFKGEDSEREWLFCLPRNSACKIMIFAAMLYSVECLGTTQITQLREAPWSK